MKTRYDVRNSKGFSTRLDDLREAFNLAKATAATDEFVTLAKIVWDDDQHIMKYRTCRVLADGKWDYFN